MDVWGALRCLPIARVWQRLGALCVWAADKETDTMLPACILPYGHKQDPHLTNFRVSFALETCECCGREAHEFTITPADDKQFWYMDDDEDTTDDDEDDDDVDSPEEDDDDVASSTSDPIEADVQCQSP